MPAAPRRRRHSSSESSADDASSSSDDGIYIPPKTVKATELTLKDDEGTIALQAPLPEEYGKMKSLRRVKRRLDLVGESDDERRGATRVIESSASGLLDDSKNQQLLAKKKRKRCWIIH